MGWPNHKFSCDVVVIFMLLFVLSMSKASIDIRLKQDNDINHQKTVQNQHWQQPLKQSQLPLVINTWNMSKATHAAWAALTEHYDPVDAVVRGCSVCEDGSCAQSVGMGGSPDEDAETTLDAMIMDGRTMDVGSVGCLRDVQNAIGVAQAVMNYTKHTLLVGGLATKFAKSMGFQLKSLQTDVSYKMWQDWQDKKCQPNFWQNVKPDPQYVCGPYSPNHTSLERYVKMLNMIGKSPRFNEDVDKTHHDTIGMVIIDSKGNVASGTTTNGATHKIPGRVGDSPIVGAGSYAQNDVGGAAATGDGDVMMRFLPSFQAVQLMSQGLDPTAAAQKAIAPIAKFYPKCSAALIAVNAQGFHGAACMGFTKFQYNVISNTTGILETISVMCS